MPPFIMSAHCRLSTVPRKHELPSGHWNGRQTSSWYRFRCCTFARSSPDEACSPRSITQLIQAARRGSLKDLKALAVAARRISSTDIASVLDTFCSVLANVGEMHAFECTITASFTSFIGLDILRGRYTSSDWLSFRDSFVSALLECWSSFMDVCRAG